VSQQGGYIRSSVECCATSAFRCYSSVLCARVTLRTPTQQGGNTQGKWITDSFQGGCRERRFCDPRVEKFWNVLEAFDATQRKGRAGRRLTICFSYRQPEHSGRIGENTDRDDGNRGKSGDRGAKLGGEAGVRPSKLGRTGGGLSYDNGGDGNGGTGSRSSGDYRKESAGTRQKKAERRKLQPGRKS
jgi:hypothetical protein